MQLIARQYDTTDVNGSHMAAEQHGLLVDSDNDNGDTWVITLVGTLGQHTAFAASEGYREGEYTDVPLSTNPLVYGSGSHRGVVMQLVLNTANSEHGCFTSRLQQVAHGFAHSTVCNTARRLVKQGLLADLGKHYDAVAARPATKWCITPAGKAWLTARQA